MNDFKKEVKIALIHKNMTASALAKELGITDSYMSDILNGVRPAPEQRKRICDFLEMDGDFNDES